MFLSLSIEPKQRDGEVGVVLQGGEVGVGGVDFLGWAVGVGEGGECGGDEIEVRVVLHLILVL